MKEKIPTGSIWRLLPEKSDRGQDRSMISKDSSTHSRYTPRREQPGGQSLIGTLGTLKQKIGSMKHFTFELPETKEAKSILTSPKSMSYLVKRTNSLEEDSAPEKILEQYKIRSSNIMGMKPYKEIKDSEQEYREFSSNLVLSKDEQKYKSSNRGFINKPMKLDILNAKNQSFEDEESFEQGKEINELHKYCCTWLDSIEKEMLRERGEIMRILEEKQRQFSNTKQRLLKMFDKNVQNTIDRDIAKLEIESIASKKEQGPLTRVTSEKIISKFSFSPKKTIHKTDSKLTNELFVKAADSRSVVSGSGSTYRENFDVIFGTINKMKKDLDRPIEELESVKNLKVPNFKEEKKPMKISLMGFKNIEQESNKKNKVSQILNRQSSSNNL